MPQANSSRAFHDAMHSEEMEAFFTDLLSEAGESALGVGRLQPVLQATNYQPGDYLNAHNGKAPRPARATDIVSRAAVCGAAGRAE